MIISEKVLALEHVEIIDTLSGKGDKLCKCFILKKMTGSTLEHYLKI